MPTMLHIALGVGMTPADKTYTSPAFTKFGFEKVAKFRPHDTAYSHDRFSGTGAGGSDIVFCIKDH